MEGRGTVGQGLGRAGENALVHSLGPSRPRRKRRALPAGQRATRCADTELERGLQRGLRVRRPVRENERPFQGVGLRSVLGQRDGKQSSGLVRIAVHEVGVKAGQGLHVGRRLGGAGGLGRIVQDAGGALGGVGASGEKQEGEKGASRRHERRILHGAPAAALSGGPAFLTFACGRGLALQVASRAGSSSAVSVTSRTSGVPPLPQLTPTPCSPRTVRVSGKSATRTRGGGAR
jgi:hypothetical protein